MNAATTQAQQRIADAATSSENPSLPAVLAELTRLLATLQDAATFIAEALGVQSGGGAAGAVELMALALERAAELGHKAELLASEATQIGGAQ